jgi:8-oxo-dGTP pyrophosphatase MutT (NUDIX family)
MASGRIRPIALCVLRRGDAILVFEGHDPVGGETFYRPLGGGIEFGETGAAAAARELREEIGADLVGLRPLGTLENIFTHRGRRWHELVLLYEGAFADPALYDRDTFEVNDDPPVTASWQPIADFRAARRTLYPDGLLDLLDEPGAPPSGRPHP